MDYGDKFFADDPLAGDVAARKNYILRRALIRS
jgi:hypothetical protein